MVISRWTRNGESAEVMESAPMDKPGYVAWNVTRGRFAVEPGGPYGSGVFGAPEEVVAALEDEGWEKQS